MTVYSSVYDGASPETAEKAGADTLVHHDHDGPVVSAAKSLTTAYRRSSERISGACDIAVAVGKHNPVVTGLSVLFAGFGCGIGCGILLSNWVSGLRRDIAAKATTGSNHANG